MFGTGYQCLLDIWKRMHKNSEASDAFSSWCFFGLNEVAFSLMFAVCLIKFLMYWNLFALNLPKSSYLFVKRLSVINWSPKEGNEWFLKIKICAICGNLLELIFFKHLSGRDSKTVNFSPGFWERFVLTKVIVRGLGKKNLEFAIWWKITGFLGALFHACEKGCWCPFFRPSGETYIAFWWLLLVSNAW